jgi:transcriptional regulator
MYIPKHFEVTDRAEIFAFIETHAFGQFISTVNGQHYSSHIPFLVADDRSRLIGHLALQNPQHRELDGQQVLITLLGPHDYISPSWYSGPGVPTWNYQAVHIYGECRVFSDSDRLKEVVDTLTRKYESSIESPWSGEYSPGMLGAIVGIEIVISELQCKFKLSQNRPEPDRQAVIEQLKSSGATDLAAAMARRETQVGSSPENST